MKKEMSKKIIVVGAYGEYNFGDDALMYIIYEKFLKNFHSNDIIFHGHDESYLNEILRDVKIVDASAKIIDNVDIIIYGGGTQFFSFSKNGFMSKLYTATKLILNNPAFLLSKISSKLVNKKNKVENIQGKMISLGVGLGPFVDARIEEKARNFYKLMELVIVRDKNSYQKCKEWELSNFMKFTDLCFQLDDEKFIKNENFKLNSIGVIVRDWKLDNKGGKYEKSLFEFVTKKRNEGYRVKFIIFSRVKDSVWLQKLEAQNEDFLFWNPEKDTIHGFIDKLAEFDLFVTSRFHGAVFSSLLRKPFISIEVDPKLKLFSEVYNKSSRNWSYPFSISELESFFSEIDENYCAFVESSDIETNKQVKISEEMLTYFNDKLIKILDCEK